VDKYTVKVSFLARERERTVPMYIPDIYQNDCDEELNQKKFTITLTVTRQERNFHCIMIYPIFFSQYQLKLIITVPLDKFLILILKIGSQFS